MSGTWLPGPRVLGTAIAPGVQPADVEELLEHGAEVVVLSKRILQALQVCPETLERLKNKGIPAHLLQTEGAVRLYNKLAAHLLRALLASQTEQCVATSSPLSPLRRSYASCKCWQRLTRCGAPTDEEGADAPRA